MTKFTSGKFVTHTVGGVVAGIDRCIDAGLRSVGKFDRVIAIIGNVAEEDVVDAMV